MRDLVFNVVGRERDTNIDFELIKSGDVIELEAYCDGLGQTILKIVPGEGIYFFDLFDSSIDGKITEALGTSYAKPANIINKGF